mmetsp:Transcript_97907/g.281667  ORF Transcript_97907/g.281667 Transcript_97907/m.281667 type:complete len:204 (+) Transcript_97907:180-791(+)
MPSMSFVASGYFSAKPGVKSATTNLSWGRQRASGASCSLSVAASVMYFSETSSLGSTPKHIFAKMRPTCQMLFDVASFSGASVVSLLATSSGNWQDRALSPPFTTHADRPKSRITACRRPEASGTRTIASSPASSVCTTCLLFKLSTPKSMSSRRGRLSEKGTRGNWPCSERSKSLKNWPKLRLPRSFGFRISTLEPSTLSLR